ncbi:MAG: sugar kinase [Gammaproteobacteria bacterium]|nr:sugar kinase [Gammaproteobacteria bacterium]
MRGPQIAVLGECMLELSPRTGTGTGNSFSLAAAGDTYNTAVALAQLGCSPEYLTGLGQDRHSQFIIEHATELGVGTNGIQRSDHLQPGLYLIDNDAQGERYFSYWRKDSAAHQTLREPSLLLPLLETAVSASRLYLSGVTLALCEASGRQVLWGWLEEFRAGGGVVIYDSNYRAALWPDLSSAREAHLQMLEHTVIFLPGVDDELLLQGLADKSALTNLLSALPLQELVLKDGSAQVLLLEGGNVRAFETAPVERVVDASGAGDAFNGGYMAARIRGLDKSAAVGFACSVAATVIQHRGAVLPRSAWQPLRDKLQDLIA